MKKSNAIKDYSRNSSSFIPLLLLVAVVAGEAAVEGSKDHRLRAAAVLYQQDEFELLSDWIQYHGGIFGPENLYIIDHNSSLPTVLNTLGLAKQMGVHVVHDDSQFTDKHRIMSKVMHEVISNDSRIDFVMPLDIDEFVITRTMDVYTTSPNAILASIAALPVDGFKYKFERIQAAACPTSYLVPYRRRILNANLFSEPTLGIMHKTFFHREGFLSTDQGNHEGRVEMDRVCASASDEELERFKESGVILLEGQCFHKTTLAIIHYGGHGLTFESFKSKIERGFVAYSFNIGRECSGSGIHYCKTWKRILADEKTLRDNYQAVACSDNNFHSTFVAAALLGDHAQVLQYPPTVTLP